MAPFLRGYGTTRFLSDSTFRNGEQAALAADAVGLMDALAIDRAVGAFDNPDANGAPHAEAGAYAAKFSGPCEHRTVDGGIGHNLPQEAPVAFAGAITDVATR